MPLLFIISPEGVETELELEAEDRRRFSNRLAANAYKACVSIPDSVG